SSEDALNGRPLTEQSFQSSTSTAQGGQRAGRMLRHVHQVPADTHVTPATGRCVRTRERSNDVRTRICVSPKRASDTRETLRTQSWRRHGEEVATWKSS